MTVQNTTPEVIFVGTGAQTSFPFTFRTDDVAWLTLSYLVNFDQIILNPDQDANPGGSVEYTVAPPLDQEIILTRSTPNVQLLDYTRYDPFDSESHEDALDRLTMQIQDLNYLYTQLGRIHPAYITSGDFGDPTVPDLITNQLIFRSRDLNDYAYLGFDATPGSPLDLVNLAWDGGVRIRGANASGGIVNVFAALPSGTAQQFHAGVAVTQTITAAAGGLEVQNLLTGAGFERVLTVSDIAGGAIDHGSLAGLADDDHPQYRNGTLPYTGNLDMGGNDIINVGLVDGVDVAAAGALLAAHVADASIHFTEASIDHLNIQNVGVNSHGAIDTHIANAGIHFTVGSISHTAISDIGSNSHAAIDAHIADPSIHYTVGSIDHTLIANVGVNSHAVIDAHIADGTIHFTDAPADGMTYGRNNNAWVVAGSGNIQDGTADGQIPIWDQTTDVRYEPSTQLTISENAIGGGNIFFAGAGTNFLQWSATDGGVVQILEPRLRLDGNRLALWGNSRAEIYTNVDQLTFTAENVASMDGAVFEYPVAVGQTSNNRSPVGFGVGARMVLFSSQFSASVGNVLMASNFDQNAFPLENRWSAAWAYNTPTADADPGPPFMRLNAVTFNTTTELYFADEGLGVDDYGYFWAIANVGDQLRLSQGSDTARWVIYEITSITDAGGYWQVGVTALDSAGTIFINADDVIVDLTQASLFSGGASNLQAAYDAAPAAPQILINGNPDPFAVRATVAGAVFEVIDTAGTIVLEVDSDPDLIVARSGVTIDNAFTNGGSAASLILTDTFTTGGGYVGGGIQSLGTVTYNNSVFIWALLQESKTYRAAAGPGFAAFTLFNAIPVIENSGNFDLVQALVLNVGVNHRRNSAGTSNVSQTIGVSFSPQTSTTAAGAVMTRTVGMTAVNVSPTWSTVAGSTVNLGTVTGLNLNQPAQALFGSSAGTENITAYYGVNWNNMTFGGGAAIRSVIRSNQAAGTNTRFLDHTGTAESRLVGNLNMEADFPNGLIRFGASDDTVLGYVGGTDEFFMQLNTPSVSQVRWSSPATDRVLLRHALAQGEFNIQCDRFSLGQSAGANGNQVGNFVTPARTIGVAGEWADFLLTQGGNLTVDGNNMSRVSAWVINPVSYANSTGTVTEADTLTVGGFPTSSPGVTITNRQSLNVIAGRSRFASAMQFPPINPAALANGNNNDWGGLLTGTNNNNMRHWARVTPDAGGSNITGIDATQAQDGDCFMITNIGTGPLNFTDQDVNSAASNRIATPNALTVTLTANETATIVRDAATDRWRVISSTGNF